MNLSDFFKKDAVIFPSGRRAAEDGAKKSKYERELKCGQILNLAEKATLGIGIATTLAFVAVSVIERPSREEINAMKAQVSRRDSLELVSAYDSALLSNIDSVHNAGNDMKVAVEEGVSLTWEQARDSFPKKLSSWTGKEFIVADHADKRLEESRDSHSSVMLVPMTISDGKTVRTITQPRMVISYTYKEEFRDRLAAEIQQRKEARTVQVAGAAKAARNAGR